MEKRASAKYRLLTFILRPSVKTSIREAVLVSTVGPIGPRILRKNRVVGVSLDMLLQVLRTFEGLATEFASMRLQGNMDANVGGDVVSLDNGDATVTPRAGQIQIVGTLTADMIFAHMVLGSRSVRRNTIFS